MLNGIEVSRLLQEIRHSRTASLLNSGCARTTVAVSHSCTCRRRVDLHDKFTLNAMLRVGRSHLGRANVAGIPSTFDPNANLRVASTVPMASVSSAPLCNHVADAIKNRKRYLDRMCRHRLTIMLDNELEFSSARSRIASVRNVDMYAIDNQLPQIQQTSINDHGGQTQMRRESL